MFDIFYDDRAVAELAALDAAVRKRIVKSVENKLAVAPQDFGKPLRGSLKGDWALRVGDWRVIYRIEKQNVIISRIGHRIEVYES